MNERDGEGRIRRKSEREGGGREERREGGPEKEGRAGRREGAMRYGAMRRL